MQNFWRNTSLFSSSPDWRRVNTALGRGILSGGYENGSVNRSHNSGVLVYDIGIPEVSSVSSVGRGFRSCQLEAPLTFKTRREGNGDRR